MSRMSPYPRQKTDAKQESVSVALEASDKVPLASSAPAPASLPLAKFLLLRLLLHLLSVLCGV
jgi:hypothetical protein